MADIQAVWGRQFERDRVRMFLAAFDFPEVARKRYTADIQAISRAQGTDGYLTFRALFTLDRFSSCPVDLKTYFFSTRSWDWLNLSWLMRFGTTYLYERYLAAWDNNPDPVARPLGLIFNTPTLRGGVVMHNAALPEVLGSTTLVHTSVLTGEPPRLTIEPYKLFLRRLVRRWGTGEPVATTQLRQPVQPRLERWMVYRLGSGPAVIVLAWLYGAWHDPHQRLMTMRNGESCLSITQLTISKRTGLAADSVKRGLATLKSEGLISTQRGDRRTYISITEACRKSFHADG